MLDRDSYTETPLGDLTLVCVYINRLICSHSDEISKAVKMVLYNRLGTDEKVSMPSRWKPNVVYRISRQAIHDLVLGDMCLKLTNWVNACGNYIMVRIGKNLNVTTTREPPDTRKDRQFLTVSFVDIAIRSCPALGPLSTSVFSFSQLSLDFYLIDLFAAVILLFIPWKFQRRIQRLKKLIDLVLLKI